MIRQPPISTRTDTLFPYPTLCRSRLAAIGPIDRFTSPARLVAFLGLNPSVHQSGNSPARHGRITKQGPCHARTMLVEAAWAAVRGPGPLRAFYERVRARRGTHVAAVAVARKIRSEERRVGEEWGRTCRSRGSPEH